MKRNYNTGIHNSVKFFTGIEVEKTPAFEKNTLFVVGLQSIEEIEKMLNNNTIDHIFFGANHSFRVQTPNDWDLWEQMITYFLKKDYWCSLDIPFFYTEEFNDGGLNEYHKFIPQICLSIPYIKLWNYNTMIKLDDKDFNATNPGVWTHSLHELMNKKVFTNWDQYNNDTIIK